jgi:hypothetical protein
VPRIALLSTSDTDLLSARASGADYLWANPARPSHTTMAEAIEGCDIVVAPTTCAVASGGSPPPAHRWSCSAVSRPPTPL